ncbi:MAG: hypothetical protein NZM42_09780, partial [Gemmatales bacterium]|nr:hypothetical protein [Gemmatales bacterium]
TQTWAQCSPLFSSLEARRKEIAVALAEQQHADGGWSNPLSLVREDETLVATPLAIVALSLCLAQSN